MESQGHRGPQGHESTEMQGPCSVCSLACGQHPSVPDSDQYWAKRQDGAMCAMHPDARQQLHLIDPHAQGSSMTDICSSSEAAGAYNAVMDGDGSSNSRMAAEAGRSVAMAADTWQHTRRRLAATTLQQTTRRCLGPLVSRCQGVSQGGDGRGLGTRQLRTFPAWHM